MKDPLAIVIPAYKAGFLHATLASLAAQRDGVPPVVIVDDASPEDLEACVAAHAGSLAIRYRRRSVNLGGRSLAASWNDALRDVEAAWIWVLCDDDVAAPDCVGGLRPLLDGPGDLIRFPCGRIDRAGAVVGAWDQPPAWESGEALLRAFLGDQPRFACLSNHVFRREALPRGFPEFADAHFSDLAAWIWCAGERGVVTAPRGSLGWREHASGVSAVPTPRAALRKYLAALQFVRWVRVEGARRVACVVPHDLVHRFLRGVAWETRVAPWPVFRSLPLLVAAVGVRRAPRLLVDLLRGARHSGRGQ